MQKQLTSLKRSLLFFSRNVPIQINSPKAFTGRFLPLKVQNEEKGYS